MKQVHEQVFEHTAILASAGSGKTFQLAHRYIKLLACGVNADRIGAFTFSRKAAGEIFEAVVATLCAAAGSTSQACLVAKQIAMPHLGSEDFLRLLRGLLVGLHRLHIGTLDSFTVGVVRTFPMELGLSVAPTLMDHSGIAATASRRDVLARLFHGSSVHRVAQEAFSAAFKQATFGQEAKELERVLDDFLDQYRTKYRAMPNAELWGSEEAIWLGACPWVAQPTKIQGLVDEMLATLLGINWAPKTIERWTEYLEAVRGFSAHSAWTDPLKFVFKKLAANLVDLQSGRGEIAMDRKICSLSEDQSRLALATVNHVMGTVLETSLKQTRGLFRVLDQFETVYDRLMRDSGKVTFEDCQVLLAGNPPTSGEVSPTSVAGGPRRLEIDYRLDARLDHWLLDEFQDTSDLQWDVLANLIDEVLQDSSGGRSFFCVGDVKQAIYGWRGGNAHLFERILDHYGPVIQEKHLAKSFRSCPEVIRTVNHLFGDLSSAALSQEAIQKWQAIWDDHTWAIGAVPDQGYAALLDIEKGDGGEKPTSADRYGMVARLIKEIDPLSRGLSVGVLVRTNDQGRAVMNHLRGACPGVRIAHEGRTAIRDNPVVELMLSLVQFAFHPGDQRAWRYVQFSPLWAVLQEEAMDRDAFSRTLLREVYEEGFRGLVRNWGAKLDAQQSLDVFGHKRLNDLLDVATIYDQAGSPDGNGFIRSVESFEVQEPPASNAVRVMTVHQAKGLQFDIVFLPNMQNGSMINADSGGLFEGRDSVEGTSAWVMRMPRREVVEADAVLSEQLVRRNNDACFEQLCVLYVAVTRPKRALYMVTSNPGRSASSVNAAVFLKGQLRSEKVKPIGGEDQEDGRSIAMLLYEQGRSDWYRKLEKPVATKKALQQTLPQDYAQRSSRTVRVKRSNPSKRPIKGQSAATLFEVVAYEGLALGSAVHALFERVEWSNQTDIDQVVSTWRQQYKASTQLKQRAEEMFRRSMDFDEVYAALDQPRYDTQLWRERDFEVVLKNKWVSGKFDRVVIRRDQQGRPVSATILDYKTDQGTQETSLEQTIEAYRPQMELYRESLSQLLSLEVSRISLVLLFTSLGRVCEFDNINNCHQ